MKDARARFAQREPDPLLELSAEFLQPLPAIEPFEFPELGQSRWQLRLHLSHAQRDALVADASGDSLDAVLCMVQAAWAERQGAPLYGLPADFDRLEGWIVTA